MLHTTPNTSSVLLTDQVLLILDQMRDLKIQYTQLIADYTALKTGYAILKADYEALKADYAALKTDHETLKANYAALKIENAALREDNATLRAENIALREDNATLRAENAALREENATLRAENVALREEVTQLKAQLKLSKHQRFGSQSESHIGEPMADPDQQTFIEVKGHTRKLKTKGRLINLDGLPRFIIKHDLDPDQRICTQCNGSLTPMGHDTAEQLEMLPQRLYVAVHVRYKYACTHCECITMSPKDKAPIPKALAGSSLLTEVIINKYAYHLPLYRQSKMLSHYQVQIPDNTLSNWTQQTGEGLKPLGTALWDTLLAQQYLQADETPAQILKPKKKGYFWSYYAPHCGKGLIAFDLRLTRSGQMAEARLFNYKGLLQTDGYEGYKKLRKHDSIVGLGCLTHARRKFAEVLKITKNQQGMAAQMIDKLKPLYALEASMRHQGYDFKTKRELRRRKAKPILEAIHAWLLQEAPAVLPKSQLGQAIQYTLKQWPYLIAYVNHGRAEIDTNGVENQIRQVALGKKNWLFMMHEDSGQVHALLYSLIGSCVLNDLNPRVYMHYVITQIHAMRQQQVDPKQLLPHVIDRGVLAAFEQAQLDRAKAVLDSS